MSVYTIELQRLIKSGFDIGLDDYPLPSYLYSTANKNAFRKALNKKITDHYMFDEICCLPPERFRQLLNNTMREIMPVKNLLYDALAENWKFYTGTTLEEAINDSHNDTQKGSHTGSDTVANDGKTSVGTVAEDVSKKTGDDKLARSGVDTVGNITNKSDSTNNYALNVASDTPGQMLNIETDIANNTYASNASKEKTNGSSTGNSTSTDTTTYNSTDTTTYNSTDTTNKTSDTVTSIDTQSTTTYNGKTDNTSTGTSERQRTVTGISGKSYAELFKEYQSSIRNIDAEVIQALATCFMSIY